MVDSPPASPSRSGRPSRLLPGLPPRLVPTALAGLVLVLAASLAGLPAAHAQPADEGDDLPVVTRTLALTNVRVVPAPGRVIEDGTVVMRDGVITAVGRGAAIPFDARVVDGGDSLTVYAGFVDGLGHAGVATPALDTDVDVERPGDPPNARAGLVPHRPVRDLIDPSKDDLAALRAAGFTAAHVVPEGQMLPGTGAVIQLAGADVNAMLLAHPASLFMQHEGAVGHFPNAIYPSTPMAVLATLRQIVRETERRIQLQAAYAHTPTGRERPPSDPLHDAFVPVVKGDRPLAVFADGPLEIHRTLALREELGLPVMLAGLSGAFEAVDALRSATASGEVPLLLTLDLPDPPDDPDAEDAEDASAEDAPRAMTPDEASSFYESDRRTRTHEDVEDETKNLQARQVLERQQYVATAATLHEAGLRFGFATKGVAPKDVRANLQAIVEAGLSEDDALRALTVDAAAALGLDDRLGTVASGKIANLVVTTGSYFDADARVHAVVIDGVVHEIDDDTGDSEDDAS